MKKLFLLIVPLFILLGFVSVRPEAGILFYGAGDSTKLEPKPVYAQEIQLMTQLLDNYHYSKIRLNDSLSSVILDAYIKTLDNNKSYFHASDIESFEKYRYELDDAAKNGDLAPTYHIYEVFRQRFIERIDYVQNELIGKEFDFTKDEYYETDRSEIAWAATSEDLNDLWRKIIKSQMLSSVLIDKKDDETKENVSKRYERLRKSIGQYMTDDVFQLYMNAVAEAYDPHTNYFSPKTAERFRMNMSLSLEGIGARLQTENDYTKVVQVMPGGPAFKSELLDENDRIIGVAQGKKGEMVDVIGWRIDEVVKLIKGPKGTTVRLQLLPAETGVNGPSEEIVLVREKIKLEDQEAKKKIIPIRKDGKNYKLGVITIPSFYMDFEAFRKNDPDYNSTTRDVKRLVGELKKEGIDGLMIDLRNNGGGSLAEAIDLTGLFIKDGPVVQVKTSDPKKPAEVNKDNDPQIVYNGPLTVMINRFSASASEIFAGAIQDYKRGVVVGEQTYGKGTVQTVVDLSRYIVGKEDVGQVKLTMQKFYRVTGSSTQHLGVSPDINFPSAFEAEAFGESSQPSALPWDQIEGTKFELTDKISDKTISALNETYNTRLKEDASLQDLVQETAELKKNLENTRISLNKTKRKKEIDDAEKRRSSTDELEGSVLDSETVSRKKRSDKVDIDDPYLKEGILILANLIKVAGLG